MYSQEHRISSANNTARVNRRYQNIEVHFKFDRSDLDLDYMDNKVSLQKFSDKIDSIGISRIDSIVILSQSSPEGVYEYNMILSMNRADTMRKYIMNMHPALDGRLYVYPDGESWSQLRDYVMKDTLMKKSSIDKVVSIIDADLNVAVKKQQIEQLPVYRYLLKTYYPRIRNSVFCIVYYNEIIPKKEAPIFDVEIKTADIAPEYNISAKPILIEPENKNAKLYVKTNALGLGLAVANGAAEIDLANHWSFTVPVYYSSWNYFKSTLKFRTFALQPELRYWLSKDNNGLFTGAHFAWAYYNIAFDGEYRYQDHMGETPAVGGGMSLGYRLPMSRNNRWFIEFSLGAGVYSDHHDKFHNTSLPNDGHLYDTVKTIYWGIDQAAISLSYSFDLKKKGGVL